MHRGDDVYILLGRVLSSLFIFLTGTSTFFLPPFFIVGAALGSWGWLEGGSYALICACLGFAYAYLLKELSED